VRPCCPLARSCSPWPNQLPSLAENLLRMLDFNSESAGDAAMDSVCVCKSHPNANIAWAPLT
jgi:hypothetical protein